MSAGVRTSAAGVASALDAGVAPSEPAASDIVVAGGYVRDAAAGQDAGRMPAARLLDAGAQSRERRPAFVY